MPKLMRDFCCTKCGKHTERYLDVEIHILQCECGGTATRTIGMPRVSLDGTDPAFPTAYDRWANVREQNRAVMARKSWRE